MKRMLLTAAALLVVLALTLPAAVARPGPDPQAAETVSGKLTASNGKFFITDASTRAVLEVRGEGLKRYVGKNVRLAGRTTPAPAGQPAVFTASQISQAATAAAGGKAAAAGVKAGLSKAAVVGIAAGGTAGTVGTLYAADVIGEDEQPVSRK